MGFDASTRLIWHAFNALDDQRTGTVSKSKLKVLAHNLSSALKIEGVDKKLESANTKTLLDFFEFALFLSEHLCKPWKEQKKNEATSPSKVLLPTLDKLDEVCWVLCARKYLKREVNVLKEEDTNKLLKIFNFLAETEEDGRLLLPLRLDIEEADFVYKTFVERTGRTWKPEKFSSMGDEGLNFMAFIRHFEKYYIQDLSVNELTIGMVDLYDHIVNDVINRGMLSKKGNSLTQWKERWFVLTPTSLAYYTSQNLRDKKGEIVFTEKCKVEQLKDRAGTKPHRLILHTDKKSYEIGATDLKCRNEWSRDLDLAISTHTNSSKEQTGTQMVDGICGFTDPGMTHLQGQAANKRRLVRNDRRKQMMDDEEKQRLEIERLDQQRTELKKKKVPTATLR